MRLIYMEDKQHSRGATRGQPKVIIGRSEYIDLPDWGVKGLHAKVDTGALTSALHVESLEVLPDGYVRFDVILSKKKREKRVHMVAPVLKWKRVRSSSGHYSRRCFVATRLRLGAVEKVIEVSLVSREEMIYRMLLGRQALEKDFLVDVGKRCVVGRKKRPKSKEGTRK